MEDFAKDLPRVRARILADLGRRGLVRERVLACALDLLDRGLFRIGSERYATENGTFGLTTLRRRHVEISNGVATFDYPAKGSKRHRIEIAAPELVPTLRALKARNDAPADFLVFRSGRSHWTAVSPEQVNEYLREAAGGSFSAKDFRTWNATVLAAVVLAEGDVPTGSSARKRRALEATRRVAELLSNTPAVCRRSYIDPRVFDRFDAGETIRPALRRLAGGSGTFPERERIERAVLRLLRG